VVVERCGVGGLGMGMGLQGRGGDGLRCGWVSNCQLVKRWFGVSWLESGESVGWLG